MSNFIIVRIPKRPKRATERLLVNEAKVLDRDGRVLYTWFSCPRCGRVYASREQAARCCASRAAHEALLGEGEVCCDRCGAVAPIGQMLRLPLDERGRAIDLCRRCSIKRGGSRT